MARSLSSGVDSPMHSCSPGETDRAPLPATASTKRSPKAIPNTEIVILPVLRHAVLLEATDKVALHVVDFLNRV